ncbi:MAG: tRNA glutamyl-Q(34) synthetase GluQRS [Oscillospiraceae bacterium]|nr:tRNA glutamyl-Q(34) synthetase GluQRS [Oscillospiraceae bacterium]
MAETVGRLAPSPSGRMHPGNAAAFLTAWLSARSRGGRVLLRIEDLDPVRCTPEWAELIRQDLTWLGLTWDEEMTPQRFRSPFYEEKLALLRSRGLVYPCWCTRGTLNAARAPHAGDGHWIYPGTCLRLTPEQRAAKTAPPSVRLRVPDEEIAFTDRLFGPQRENLARDCGDFVLKKADGTFAYQLAVVADDVDGGVTEVVRGRDLLGSTARQIYLTRLLGGREASYLHVPMLLGPGGRKLSKRDLDLDMGELRRRVTPERMIGELAFRLGLIDRSEPVSAAELARDFDPARLSRTDVELGTEFCGARIG